MDEPQCSATQCAKGLCLEHRLFLLLWVFCLWPCKGEKYKQGNVQKMNKQRDTEGGTPNMEKAFLQVIKSSMEYDDCLAKDITADQYMTQLW
jgi:hypothetical protein